ncbi:MAG: hypothetical protein ACJ748_11235 [Flavisolibacter sp.]
MKGHLRKLTISYLKHLYIKEAKQLANAQKNNAQANDLERRRNKLTEISKEIDYYIKGKSTIISFY